MQLDQNLAFRCLESVTGGVGDELVNDHSKAPTPIRWYRERTNGWIELYVVRLQS